MAIKLPDPGNGIPEQKTGNDEWTNMQIVRENFADKSNAASRMVGTDTGNVMEVGAFGLGLTADTPFLANTANLTNVANGFYGLSGGGHSGVVIRQQGVNGSKRMTIVGFPADPSPTVIAPYYLKVDTTANGVTIKEQIEAGNFYTFYTTQNTTKDTATGFLKASSPVLHVYNDKITKIHEAELLDITVDKKGTGHYEILGTTGLRENDGWNMSPPRDLHGNVLCMIDVTEKDGAVILKTYKRKFDLELAAIVHDWDNPIDIPEGACVEFRFNDLPQEQLDEPAI